MNRRGYTLVEMMVATALTLVIMVAVVNGFGFIGDKITNARAALEMSEELRGASARLIADLDGVTAPMTPPLSPGAGQGYFEITEGPGIGAVDSEIGGNPVDTTVGDLDDYIIFTTRSRSAPFVGRNDLAVPPIVESHEAEVAWFVRGRTLYRRVLLVAPNAAVSGNGSGFYAGNDISVRRDNSSGTIYANTLADLTRPENRFAHQPLHWVVNAWNTDFPTRPPFCLSHPHFCVSYDNAGNWTGVFGTVWASRGGAGRSFGLPTLAECSQTSVIPPTYSDLSIEEETHPWIAGGPLRAHATISGGAPNDPARPWPYNIPEGAFDAWRNPHPWDSVRASTSIGSLKRYCDPEGNGLLSPPIPSKPTTRMNEDIILNNVLSFDVKVWDPTAPLRQVGTGPVLAPGDPGYNPANGTIVARGAYVDLNYAGRAGALNPRSYSSFSGPGRMARHPNAATRDSLDSAAASIASVYDTWSTHFDEGGPGTDGFDSNNDGVVDDPGELLYPPPYSARLRGVQIKIRTYEPATRQIREVTVVHNFVSK